jgi:N6-adenosine-specific RNA methylase IME4
MYRTIVADPPWITTAGRSIGRYEMVDGKQIFGVKNNNSRPLAYPSMTADEIRLAIPVESIADDNCHLYLWTINRYIADAFDVARSWGFKYSTMLVWAKAPMGGGLGGAFGISTEYCLYCRRGSPRSNIRMPTTWFNWKRPYKNGYPNHSAKPPEFFEMVRTVSEGPYAELFARAPRQGWDVWGNEVASDIQLTIGAEHERQMSAV